MITQVSPPPVASPVIFLQFPFHYSFSLLFRICFEFLPWTLSFWSTSTGQGSLPAFHIEESILHQTARRMLPQRARYEIQQPIDDQRAELVSSLCSPDLYATTTRHQHPHHQ